MERKSESLHDIAHKPGVEENVKRKVKIESDSAERYRWDQHLVGREKGNPQAQGLKGAAYPLHRAIAHTEGRTLPQDELDPKDKIMVDVTSTLPDPSSDA